MKKCTASQPTQHQTFLDLGQKLFGKNNECLKCGMFYVIGDVEDERRHSQLCAKVLIYLTFYGHRSHDVLD